MPTPPDIVSAHGRTARAENLNRTAMDLFPDARNKSGHDGREGEEECPRRPTLSPPMGAQPADLNRTAMEQVRA